MAFPTSPSNNQVHKEGNRAFVYDSTLGVWDQVRETDSTVYPNQLSTAEIGSGVRDILFENMTPVTSVVLAKKVEDVIENFEPRARLVGVRALPNLDRNEYEVTIEFFVVNTPTELIDMTIFLEVLR